MYEQKDKYKTENCLQCNISLYTKPAIRRYSYKNHGVTLCPMCQKWLEQIKQESTFFAVKLYFALKVREIPAQLEKFDGFKHIDIAIPKAKINIEVDGVHHNFDSEQALRDLKRTCYSMLKGYATIRIPNSLVYKDITCEETADYLAELIHTILRNRNS